ncbi:hypothetical protein IE81DRAFT_83897 [Ceraceosorus guamensis]|uniref:Uncharacterized protein n=1 Tax=Ceraceosorus guamensis TaxID=1522189 RepID=A0A316W8G6_9BASI|nr:hypothetical protein IE81DRAFT_83897 [Ceraceosorus guamensis]PWN46122.1 hypothetical protein IE81DRAFT_83897 [Ceraceosorus guamensis]
MRVQDGLPPLLIRTHWRLLPVSSNGELPAPPGLLPHNTEPIFASPHLPSKMLSHAGNSRKSPVRYSALQQQSFESAARRDSASLLCLLGSVTFTWVQADSGPSFARSD